MLSVETTPTAPISRSRRRADRRRSSRWTDVARRRRARRPSRSPSFAARPSALGVRPIATPAGVPPSACRLLDSRLAPTRRPAVRRAVGWSRDRAVVTAAAGGQAERGEDAGRSGRRLPSSLEILSMETARACQSPTVTRSNLGTAAVGRRFSGPRNSGFSPPKKAVTPSRRSSVAMPSAMPWRSSCRWSAMRVARCCSPTSCFAIRT